MKARADTTRQRESFKGGANSPFNLTSWLFLLTHDMALGAMDGYVDMTVVGGKVAYSRKGAGGLRR